MQNSVNERIKVLRNQLRISQQDLANAIDTTVTSISRIEKGHSEPRSSTLQKISKQFNVSMNWLTKGEGEIFTESSNEPLNRESVNPWENALVKELKEEVTFLRELLKNMTLPQANRAGSNFNSGADSAGFLFEKPISSVRAVA